MPGIRGGQGDAETTLRLLWRRPGPGARRGPRPALALDDVVAAGIAAADATAGADVSLRQVGERLGVTAMALYTYVAGKAELLDLMHDAVHAEAELPADGGDWHAAVHAWAGALLAVHVRHPWTLRISFARPVLGPHEQAVLEALVGILRDAGLAPAAARPAVTALYHLVRGTAETVADARLAAADGPDEQRWWAERAAALAAVVPDHAERFPATAWLATAPAPVRPDDGTPWPEAAARQALDAGIDLLLAGLSADGRG
ncbi:TetR/AcrR family transcriptional regulator C-terminal domain-containing protein [Geodermatophilus sp. SYSU D00815]